MYAVWNDIDLCIMHLLQCIYIACLCTHVLMVVFVLPNLQSGLACIRERLLQETVHRYGVKEEFVKAEAETMKEVLVELRRRYIVIFSTCYE